MTFIIATIVIFLGIIVFSFTISNIILILFFAIPFTKKLERTGLLKKNNITSSYIIALFVQVLIFFGVTTIFYAHSPYGYFISLMIGYVLGTISIITKLKEFGLNMNNFSDYFEKNKTYFGEEIIDKYNENKAELLKFIIMAIDKK